MRSPSCFAARWLRVALCVTAFASLIAPLPAANPPRIRFDVPAGDARPMLRQFATQARCEIVFTVESVDGVTTKAIKGEMTAQEAIDRMLEGTGLVAAVDVRTGAFAVRKGTADPNASRVGSPTATAHPARTASRDDSAIATGAPGFLRGSVVDGRSGAPLVGAEVRIAGQGSTVTDEDGTFAMPGVPPGTYQLSASYLGYDRSARTIVFAGGDRAVIDFKLTPTEGAVMLDAVRVIAEYDADMRARNRERNAESFSNIISSDALGNLPDAQVADALRRMPGVSAVRTLGESSTIIIRGADPSLNSVNLDGVSIQSTANDGNTVDLSMFLTEQLKSIEVVKAITPDLPADSVGGYVNFETKNALDYNRRVFGLRAKVGYDDLQKRYTPEAGVTYLTQFGRDKRYGLSLSASYVRRSAQSLLLETGRTRAAGPFVTPTGTYTNVYLPTSIQPRINHLDRDRYGVTAGLDWKAFEHTRLYLKSSLNIQEDDSAAERIRWFTSARTPANFDLTKPFRVSGDNVIEATTVTAVVGDNMMRGLTLGRLRQASTIQKIGGRTEVDRLRLDYSMAYSKTKTNQELLVPLFSTTGVAVRLYENEVGRPHYESLAGVDLNDPDLFRLNGVEHDINRKNYDLWGAKLDAAYPLRLLGKTVTLRAGGVGSRSKKVRDDNQFIPSPSAGGVGFKDGRTILLSDPMIKLIRLPSNYLGSYDLGFGADATAARKWAGDLVHSGLLAEATGAAYVTARTQNDYTIEQEIMAGYLMGTLKTDRWNVIAGARLETTADRGVALARNGALLTPIHMERDYSFLAPNLQLRYRLGEKWQFRSSYSETMRRPPYDSAAPRTTFSIATNGNLTASSFNPDLKHQISRNTDVSIEYYLGRTNRVTLAGFDKQIQDTLFTESTNLRFEDAPRDMQAIFPPETAPSTPLTITRSSNGGKGRIQGVEVEYLQRFSFLPGIWRKFGLSASFTYIDSSWTRFLTRTPTTSTTVTTAFPFQSRTLGNVTLDYGSGKFYASLSYNWRDPFLRSVNASDRKLDQWQGAAESIDWKLAYKFRPKFGIELRGQNMTRDPDAIWFGGPREQRLTSYEQTGIMLWLGVNWEQ